MPIFRVMAFNIRKMRLGHRWVFRLQGNKSLNLNNCENNYIVLWEVTKITSHSFKQSSLSAIITLSRRVLQKIRKHISLNQYYHHNIKVYLLMFLGMPL